jgi:peptide/nickel transport system permease protein
MEPEAVDISPSDKQPDIKVRNTMSVMRRYPVIPILIVLALIFTAIFANVLAPFSPYEQSLPDRLKPPFWVEGGSTRHLLGTDLLGRDVLSRLIFGSRVSLVVALMGILVAGSIGAVLGILSGFYGGKVDALIMRTCDATLSLPIVLLALLLAVILGPSLANLIYIMGLVLWARYARVVRGEVMSWKEQEFIAYARVAGASSLKIMIRHIFPNIVNTLMVLVTFQTGYVIILESFLSFLGAGVPPPTPTWGAMVAEGRGYIITGWWLSVFSGLAISMVVLSLNLFGDWLRDYLDPKLRQV